MKGDGLAKHYDKLSLDEQFRLRLHALARQDLADCERLDRACPARHYREYCARLEASDVLTLGTLLELMPKLAKLQMVDAFRPLVEYLETAAADAAWLGYLDGYAAGWKAAGKRGEPPEVSEDELSAASERGCPLTSRFSDLLDQVAGALAASARTPRDGLAAFCRDELGVPLDVLLGAWGRQALPILAEHAEALDAAEPDPDELALLTRVLALAWRRHGLGDPTAEPDDELRAAAEALGWKGA